MNKRSRLKRRLSCLLAFLLATAFVVVQAGQAADTECQKHVPAPSARLAEIRLLERLTAKLTEDLHLLESAQGSKTSAVQKSSPSKHSLLQQRIQSLERKKALLLADKDINIPAAQAMTGQKISVAGKQVSINSYPGSISGKVVNPAGAPIVNVYVFVMDIVTMEDAYTVAPNGSYTVDNLPDSSEYIVYIDGATATGATCSGSYYGYYNASSPPTYLSPLPETVAVTGGGNTNLETVTLECSIGGGGSITGQMKGYNGGIPGHVDVYDENYKWVASDRIEDTDDGHYEVTGLDASKQYRLFFDADTEYISQWYDVTQPVSPTLPPGDFCTADPVPVPAVRDITLTKGNAISGMVTDGATPMIGVFVDVFNEKYPSLYEFDYTDIDGTYKLSGLPAGAGYKVRFKPANNLHALQWYRDKYDFDHADSVPAPSLLADVHLALGGSITGKVTSQKDGAPITFSLVNAEVTDPAKGTFSAVGTTDENGNYTISGLPVSSGYKAQFIASFIEYNDATTGKYYHVNEWYSGKVDFATATPFSVPASNIGVQLAVGGSISGYVTDGTGNPVKGVMVEVYHESSASSRAVSATDKDGNYIVTGVPYGNNKVRFFIDSQNGYCSPDHTCYVGWYGGNSMQDASQVELTASQRNITGINAVLASCGGISGRVKDAGTGNPVAGVRVEVYSKTLSPAGYVIASGLTDKDGIYTIIGVPVANDYKVKFVADSLGYTNQWYAGQEYEATATSVEVKASENTPHIDAALSKPTTAGNSAAIVPTIIKTLLLP